MAKKVLLSSFHTCSPYALADFKFDIDAIVSLDSHIDLNLLGYREEVIAAIEQDKPLRYAVGRAATHAIFARLFEDTIENISLIIPIVSLEHHAVNNFIQVREMMMEHMHEYNPNILEKIVAPANKEDVINLVDYARMVFRINIVASPPKDPLTVINRILENTSSIALDIDIDYFADMQGECYTPLNGAKPSELGNLERTLRTIRSTKPEVITISEATVAALNNPDSKTNYLLGKLKNMGYEIERFFVYKSDEEAYSLMKKWEVFSEYVKTNIAAKSWDIHGKSLQEESDAIREYAEEFFDKRS